MTAPRSSPRGGVTTATSRPEQGRVAGGRTSLWAGLGGVVAALLASLCCAGPLLFVALGVGAGLATTFEPLRPVFAVVMIGMFAVAFYTLYGRRFRGATAARRGANAEAGGAGTTGATDLTCALPRNRDRVLLWLAALLALVLWTFPTWSRLLV
ncbi:MAG: mercuric transporter MerT family protein [Gemmatimonadota bacterium]|nr:mercuric transporter MerT family protein [Gemmatimonadota bacterium]